MRILLFTTHLNIGGITSYTISLAKALKEKNHEVFVASSGGVMVPELVKDGVSHINININTKSVLSPKVLVAFFEIYNFVKKMDIDIIHAQTRVTQVVGFFVALFCKIGFISTCHGFFRKNLDRCLLPAWGDRVIAISEAVYKHLIEDFKVAPDKISLIYNGINIRKFLRDFSSEERSLLKDRFGIKKDCAVLGTIGRFTPDKGQDVILSAFYMILKKRPATMLIFVGDGSQYHKIVDMAERFGLTEKVIFIKPQIHTIEVLSVMDVFIFAPKRREGLGLVLLEAMASGKPVVATDVGGISSIVKNSFNGFLVQPCRPELLVEPILKLLEDKELYRRMSQACRETVVQKFSIDGVVDKVEAVYKEICLLKGRKV